MADPLYLRHLDDIPHALTPEVRRLGADAVWTSDDTKRAILFSMVPGGISACAFAMFSKDGNLIEWWNASTRPDWAPTNTTLYGLMDVATLAPVGYATYLIYKHGGGLNYNDTKLALGLYAGSMLCAFLTIPLIKRKNYVCLFRNTVIMHLTAVGAAVTFYKIDRHAGMLMTPFALWSGFYTLLTYSMSKMNTSESSERSTL